MPRHISLKASILSFFAAIVLVYSTCCDAQTNAQDEKTLKGIVGQLIEQYEGASASNGAALVSEGNIMVEPSDGYYAVTLPHLKIRHEDGSYTEIGMVSVNAIKSDVPEQWKMTVALPTPIIHYDSNNMPAITTSIGAQTFAGIWHEKLGNFLKMNVRYKDVAVDYHAEQTHLIIPDISVIYDLKKNDKGLWSGPANIDITDMGIAFDRDGSKAKISKIKLTSNITDYSLTEAANYQEKIDALAESYEEDSQRETSGQHVMALYNLIADFTGNAWEGFNFTIEASDVNITEPASEKTPESHAHIKDGLLGFDINGFRSGKVSMGIKFVYNGLEIVPATEGYNQATPDHIDFNLRVNNLPYKEIIELGRTSLSGMLTNPALGNIVGLQALFALPQLLTQAETNLTLSETTLGNRDYHISTDGKFTADLNAKMGVTGSAKTVISGMDNLIDALNKESEKPDLAGSKKAKIDKSLQMLAVIKMAGQIEKGKDGKESRTYNFEIDKDGKTLLNGTDLQILLQSIGQ